jgi:hypothetical protein
MTALFLQVEHHIRQTFRANTMSQTSLAQREILTICTSGLTIAKEDGASSSRTADRRFLSAMDIPRRYYRLCPRPADARFSDKTITTAILRADGATA